MDEEALRKVFEATVNDSSFNHRRGSRGGYTNPRLARDWTMVKLGAQIAGGLSDIPTPQIPTATVQWAGGVEGSIKEVRFTDPDRAPRVGAKLYEQPMQPVKAHLTQEQIVAVWQGMPGGPEGWLKEFGFVQFAQAIIDKMHEVGNVPERLDQKSLDWIRGLADELMTGKMNLPRMRAAAQLLYDYYLNEDKRDA